MEPEGDNEERPEVQAAHLGGHIANQGRRILKEHRFPPSWRVAWLATFCYGFSTTLDMMLAKTMMHDPHYGRDIAEAVADVRDVASITGFVLGSVLMQAVGRILALYYYGVGVIFAATATVVSTLLPPLTTPGFLICVFQAVQGLFVTVGGFTSHVYLSEVAPDDDRGVVLGIQHSFYLLGRLAAGVFPHRVAWQWLALLSLAPYLIFVSLMSWLVESPRWLLQVDRTTDAQRAYELLGIAITGDECVLMAIRAQRLHTPPRAVVCALFVFWLRLLGGSMGMRKFQDLQLVGDKDLFYGRKDMAMIIFQIIVMPGIIFLTDTVGRRFLVFVSSLLITGILLISSYFFWRTTVADTLAENATYERALVCAALCSVVAYSLGLGPVAYLLCIEILPPRRHGLLAGLTYATDRTLFFVFQWSLRANSDQVLYFVLAGVSSALSLAVLVRLLPETKLLALERIPSLFSDDLRVRAAAAQHPQMTGGTHELAHTKAVRQFPLRDFADTYEPPAAQEESQTGSSLRD